MDEAFLYRAVIRRFVGCPPNLAVIPSGYGQEGSQLRQTGHRRNENGDRDINAAGQHRPNASDHASEQILPGPYAVRMTPEGVNMPGKGLIIEEYLTSSGLLTESTFPRGEGFGTGTHKQIYRKQETLQHRSVKAFPPGEGGRDIAAG